MPGSDPAGPGRRPHPIQRWDMLQTGASRSSTPRSASTIAAVAVMVFVIENHGHTMPGPFGMIAGLSFSQLRVTARSAKPGRYVLSAELDRHGRVRETLSGHLWRRVIRDPFWEGGLSGYGVGDLGEDI
jgi:hypothetical protein